MKQILDYTTQCLRHKLVFTACSEIAYTDIGYLLSQAIESSLNNKRLSLIADEHIDKIFRDNIKTHPTLGKYIALSNIGILFEPILKLDLRAKIDKWSRELVLIIDPHEGLIKNNIFYLGGLEDQQCTINLSEISHKTIYNEI